VHWFHHFLSDRNEKENKITVLPEHTAKCIFLFTPKPNKTLMLSSTLSCLFQHPPLTYKAVSIRYLSTMQWTHQRTFFPQCGSAMEFLFKKKPFSDNFGWRSTDCWKQSPSALERHPTDKQADKFQNTAQLSYQFWMVDNPCTLRTEQQRTDPFWMDSVNGMAVFNNITLFLAALMWMLCCATWGQLLVC